MDKRYKWPINQHRSGYPEQPIYAQHAPRNNCLQPYKNYVRPNHNYNNYNKHNANSAPNNYYKPPRPPRPSGGRGDGGGWQAHAPVSEPDQSGNPDVVALIMENNNLKRMIVLHLGLMQEQTDNLAAKEKDIEEQTGRIRSLLSQKQELMQQISKLTLSVDELRKQLRRCVKRSHNDENEVKAKIQRIVEKETQTVDWAELEPEVPCYVQQPPLKQSKNVIVSDVTDLPPSTPVTLLLESSKGKSRGEFNGGKKVSTIFMDRVHQESSSLQENEQEPNEEAELKVDNVHYNIEEEQIYQDADNSHEMETVTETIIGAEEELGAEEETIDANVVNNGHVYEDDQENQDGVVDNNCEKIFDPDDASPTHGTPFAHSTPHHPRIEESAKQEQLDKIDILHGLKLMSKASKLREHEQQPKLVESQQLLKDETRSYETQFVKSALIKAEAAPVQVELSEAKSDVAIKDNAHIQKIPNTIPTKPVQIPTAVTTSQKRKHSAIASKLSNHETHKLKQKHEPESAKKVRIGTKSKHQSRRIHKAVKSLENAALTNENVLLAQPGLQKTKEHLGLKTKKKKKLRSELIAGLELESQQKEQHDQEQQTQLEEDQHKTEEKLLSERIRERKREQAETGKQSKEPAKHTKKESQQNKVHLHQSKEQVQQTKEQVEQTKEQVQQTKDQAQPTKEQAQQTKEQIQETKEQVQQTQQQAHQTKDEDQATKDQTPQTKEKTQQTKKQAQHTKELAQETKEQAQETQEETELSIEEKTMRKLKEHLQKQQQRLASQPQQQPLVRLKKSPLQNTALIYPPLSTVAAITPAPSPTNAASPKIFNNSTITIQTPLTPQSISSVGSGSNSSSSTSTSNNNNNSNNTSNNKRSTLNSTQYTLSKLGQGSSRYLTSLQPYTTRSWEDQEFHCDNEFFLEEADELLSDTPSLEIPEWKIVNIRRSADSKSIEALSDEDFERRHDKYVRDEIERKKRDARYIREQMRSEALRMRHNQDEVLVPLDPLPTSTFYPLPEDIEAINFVSEVPVQAFGENMVNIQAPIDHFTLPWLDAASTAAAAVATLSSKKLITTSSEARHQEMNSSYVFLKRRKRQRRR